MFDSDTLMEIYSYLVELRTIKRKKLEYEISFGVGSADAADINRLDGLLSCFADFFKEV